VLFQHLDLATLAPAAVARARERVLVASALWGVVALDDRIPAYRLSIGARLPALTKTGGLAAFWRPALTAALPDEPGALIVDMRSGSYAAAWRPKRATLVEVKASTADGKPISHMAKAVRGTVTRELLSATRPATSPEDVMAAATQGDGVGHVALHVPAMGRRGDRRRLEGAPVPTGRAAARCRAGRRAPRARSRAGRRRGRRGRRWPWGRRP
jgi:hypothetical protein